MASSRENADDDDTTVGRGAQPAPAGHRRKPISACWRGRTARPAMSAARPLHSRTRFAAARCSRRWRRRARARLPKDPALAELVRKEQDLGKQINAQLGTLNNVLSLPSGERDEKGVQAINASINSLRAERHKARQEISQQFPAYADLVSPKPPSVEQIKATLDRRRGDAVVLFRADQQFRLGGPEETARSRSPRSRLPAATSRARFASCARRWSRRRR